MASRPPKPSFMVIVLGLSMLFAFRFVMLAPSGSGYFVRIDRSKGKNATSWAVVRDARGHESNLTGGTGLLKDVQPGDPVHKSPGNDDIRPWPKGEPFPEPVWFRFGYHDVLADILGILALGVFAALRFFGRQKLAENPERES